MEGPLSNFKLARFQFVLRALNPMRLPFYRGSTFRGTIRGSIGSATPTARRRK